MQPAPISLFEREMRDHPLWRASCALLEPRGELEGVRARTLVRLRELNEAAAGGFCVSTEYLVALARR